MFKRFDNKQLLIALGALVVLYIGVWAFGGKADRTFRKTLVSIDTTRLSKIVITSPKESTPVELTRSGPGWQVNTADGTVPTAENIVERALESFNYLEATQLVSRSEDEWAGFQVDTSGTRVEVFEGDEKVSDMVLGRFEYKQSGMASYVREYEEDEIYAVNGYLDASFNRAANDWRDKTLIKGSASEWSGLNFRYPADSSFQLVKGLNGEWGFSDTTIQANTSEISSYLSSLGSTNGTEFVARPVTPTPVMELTIQTVSAGTIEIKSYPAAEGYVLSSSLNPSAFFADKSGTLVEKIFVGPGKFLEDSSGG
jgi:hypothetical protein